MRKELFALLIYLGVVVFFNFTGQLGAFSRINWFFYLQNTLLLIAGGVVGFNFILVEKLWQAYYLYPQQKSSTWVRQYVQSVIKTKKMTNFKTFLNYLYNTDFSGIGRSILNSLLFHLAWLMVAAFTLTSTNVSFGQGLVMGLGFYLCYSAVVIFKESWQKFRDRTFWMVQREFNQQEVKTYFYALVGAFVLLTIFFI